MRNHWQERRIAQLWNLYWSWSLWMCGVTCQRATVYHYVPIPKSRYVGYMYFWTVCMQMHLCLLNEKKREKKTNNHTSTEIQLCLREVFCCSWGLRIFLRNKKSHSKLVFAHGPGGTDPIRSALSSLAFQHDSFTALFIGGDCWLRERTRRLRHFCSKSSFFLLGSCRRAELHSTTSEHEHVRMSAARGFESAAARADKTRQRKWRNCYCWQCSQIKSLAHSNGPKKKRPKFGLSSVCVQPPFQLCNEIFITCTRINCFPASLLVTWTDEVIIPGN